MAEGFQVTSPRLHLAAAKCGEGRGQLSGSLANEMTLEKPVSAQVIELDFLLTQGSIALIRTLPSIVRDEGKFTSLLADRPDSIHKPSGFIR